MHTADLKAHTAQFSGAHSLDASIDTHSHAFHPHPPRQSTSTLHIHLTNKKHRRRRHKISTSYHSPHHHTYPLHHKRNNPLRVSPSSSSSVSSDRWIIKSTLAGRRLHFFFLTPLRGDSRVRRLCPPMPAILIRVQRARRVVKDERGHTTDHLRLERGVALVEARL